VRALILLGLSGCTSLLGISDPTPAGGPIDSGIDSSIDSNIDAPPACATSITLKAEVASDVGAAGSDFAIGRYDNGLTSDIVVALGTSALIMHGDSTGAFGGDGMKITIPTAAVGVVSDDFDTDADDDIVLWTATNVVMRRLNRTLNPPVEAEQALTGPFTNITRILAENLDGALRPDLFVYDTAAGSRVFTSNLGTPGTFSKENLVGTGADELILMLQIDAAQRDDALFVNGTFAKVAIQVNVGGFGNPTNVAMGANSSGVAMGKFDSDNLPDLVVSTAQGLVLFRQNPAAPGTFQMHGMISPVQSPVPMLVGDVNGDGRDDIITPTAAVLQCPAVNNVGVFTQVETLAAAKAKLVDVTGDGKLDLVRLDGNAIKVRAAL
jgi:FG-GAP-like repeat